MRLVWGCSLRNWCVDPVRLFLADSHLNNSAATNLFRFRAFVVNESHGTGENPGKKKRHQSKNSKLDHVPTLSVNSNFAKVSSECCQFLFLCCCVFLHVLFSAHCCESLRLVAAAGFIGVCLQFYGLGSLRSCLAPCCGLRGRSWQAGISLFIARPSEQVKTRTTGTS